MICLFIDLIAVDSLLNFSLFHSIGYHSTYTRSADREPVHMVRHHQNKMIQLLAGCGSMLAGYGCKY